MRYIDDYGNEFNNREEIKAYAIQNLYEDDEAFVRVLDGFVSVAELLNWIIENPTTLLKKFKEDYAIELRFAEEQYAEDYFYDCEEIED